MNRLSILLLTSVMFGLASPAAKAQDRSDLLPIFQKQVSSCYLLPIKARGIEPVIVEVRLEPNGALSRKPEVISGLPDSPVARAALRAIDRCAPFEISKELAPRYRDWKVMRIQFNTQ